MIIKGDEENLKVSFTVDNMVKLTFLSEGGNIVKYITFDDFVGAILAAQHKDDKIITENITPILPPNTIQYIELANGGYIIVLIKNKCQVDFDYGDKIYKKVGIPTLLFAFRMYQDALQEGYVVSVKDKIIKAETPIFFYPFSNVFKDTRICWGNNKLPAFPDVLYVSNIADMFLSMPNSSHNYGFNSSGLEYRPLLEALEGKNFEESILLSANMTYSEWISSIIN